MRVWIGTALLLVLGACGPSTPKPEVFSEANAWKDPIPSHAKMVSPAEFERQLAAGELTLDNPAQQEKRFAEAQAQIRKYQSELAALPGSSDDPTLARFKESVDLPTMPDGNYVLPVTLSDGSEVKVVTLGKEAAAIMTVESYKSSNSAANQLEAYRSSYEFLPETQRSGLPSPSSLQNKSLDEVMAARAQLNQATGQMRGLHQARPAPGPVSTQQVRPQADLEARDGASDCTRRANGIYLNFNWPLKNFQTSIKQQGMRGTCWAFTAIAAIESRDMVVSDQVRNLSEQFLVNKVKREWGASDYVDGGGADWTLGQAVQKRFNLPLEDAWPYNPAYGRPSNAFQGDDPATPQNEQIAGTMASYRGACGPAPIAGTPDRWVYNWNCSETAHQSSLICTAAGTRNFCGYYVMVPAPGAFGSPPDNTTSVWNRQQFAEKKQAFPLNDLILQLNNGRSLLAVFPIYRGFDRPDANGFVTDTSTNGYRGDHLALIVGHIDNATLHARLPNAPQDSDGFFILKNSWGCAADGGYYYLPVAYVRQVFYSLSVLNMTASRGANWQRERANPTAQDRPNINVLQNPARADLRREVNLASFFRVSQPAEQTVNLEIRSNVDGVLYNGPWSTATLVFGADLRRTFSSTGRRTLSLVARNGSTQTEASLAIDVVNSPPVLDLQYSGIPRLEEDFQITAVVTDLNETSATGLCANTAWSVEAPDTLSSPNGCVKRIRFGSTGRRTVRVSTRDSEGVSVQRTLELDVQAAAQNPFPRITKAGVYSREFTGGTFRFCGSVDVAAGATIDLRLNGCRLLITQPAPLRYYAGVEVENPTNETLAYDWKLYATNLAGTSVVYQSDQPTFDLYSPGNTAEVTSDCRITLTVRAPEASRNKSLTVWTGRCTYYATNLR